MVSEERYQSLLLRGFRIFRIRGSRIDIKKQWEEGWGVYDKFPNDVVAKRVFDRLMLKDYNLDDDGAM